ncbi:MAG: methionine biosynthesis protein MetW [Alphaproteobacteria bacterium]|nr:methionine biosynthesis protein MetW [Alphaproteobacteria bacterium]
MMNRTPPPRTGTIRTDLQLIADMVAPSSRVLDVGCGDGTLLSYLVHFKGVDGRGIELSPEGVSEAVAHGLAVIQGDAESVVADYPSDAFDFVILSQTLPAIYDVRAMLAELLRIGRHAVVSFPNFAYWRLRAQLLVNGRAPDSRILNAPWYATPNIRLVTIADFLALAGQLGVHVERAVLIGRSGRVRRVARPGWFDNLRAEQAVFLISRD